MKPKQPTVLVPTDFQAGSRAALEIAAALARRSRAGLLVLHVCQESIPTLGEDAGIFTPLRMRLKQFRPLDSRIGLQHQLVEGSPGDQILRVARQQRPLAIVMSSRSQGELRRLLLGSVTRQVARDAPCPLLILAPGTVAVDADGMGK